MSKKTLSSTTRTATTFTSSATPKITEIATQGTRPTGISSSLAPFKPFKFTTFKPFSFYTFKSISIPSTTATTTTTPTTTKLPTATALHFVNSYRTTTPATTRQPVFNNAPRTNVPSNFAFAPTFKPFTSIGTTKPKKYSYGIYNRNFFSSTPPPTTARNPSIKQTVGPRQSISTFERAKQDAPTDYAPPKFNLFDLYLGRGPTTSPPQSYRLAAVPSFVSQSFGYRGSSPYMNYTTQATPFLNTYKIPQTLPSKASKIALTTTQRPSAQQIQQLFKSHVTSIGQSLGIQNSTYASLDSFITSPKRRVYRYSFSGTTKKSPSLQ